MRIPSGVTDQYIYFVAVDSTDFTTRETGLSSFTVYRSRNGGAAAVMTTPTINETDATNMPGVYELLLDEDMTIDSGDDTQEMAFHITHAGMHPVTRTIELYRPKITAGQTLTASGGSVNSAVQSVAANAITATAIASNAITSAKIAASAIGASQIATDAITAAKIAADAIGASELAADAVAEIADAVWDELQSGHVTAGSFGEIATEIANILVDTAEIGTAGAGLTNLGGSANNWNTTTPPTAAAIADAVWDEDIVAAHGTADTAGLIMSELTKRSVTWATAVNSGSMLDQIADDGTAAFDRTTDSLQAIADSGGGGPTAAQIADAVWDEAQADHVTAGTFGVVASEVADILVDTAEIGAAGAGLSAIPWNASWDAEVQSEVNDGLVALHLDHLLAVDYDPASKPGTATALLNEIVENDGGVSRFTANALEQGPSGSSVAAADLGIIASGTAQSATATTIVLAAATSFADDLIIGATIVITGGTGVGQSRVVTDWVSTTDTATVDTWTTTPDATSTYNVFASPPALSTPPDVNVTQVGGTSQTAGDLAALITTVDTVVDNILVDTAEIGAAGAGLTNINLPDQTMNITGNITGNLSGSVGSVTGAVGSVTGNVGGIAGTITTLDALDAAQDTQHGLTRTDIGNLNDVSVADILTTQMTESYAADGAAPTIAQALMLIQQQLGEFSISGTTLTVKKVDGATTAATFTLNDGSDPTSITRAT